MVTDDESRYEALRFFIILSGNPARGGRKLLSLEQEFNETAPPKDDHEPNSRRDARAQYQAVISPCSLATGEQIQFCRRAKEEMERLRAMHEGGWKTPIEEGFDAFNPKIRPVDWDGKENPYQPGTTDHEEWLEGYNDAIMDARVELGDGYEARLDEYEAKYDRQVSELTLDSFFACVEGLATKYDTKFLALAEINSQFLRLAGTLVPLQVDLEGRLPCDLQKSLFDLINRIAVEGFNRDVERKGSVEERLQFFKRLLQDLKSLGAEIERRAIMTPYGAVEADLYHFANAVHDRQYREANAPGSRARRKRKRTRKRK